MELRRRLWVRVLAALTTAAPILAAVFGVSTLLVPQPAGATTTIPYMVNFQGRLTDNNGNVLADGSYNVKFRIFDAGTGGTNQWEGDRVYGASDHRVTVQNGLFNIQFGDTSQGDPALSPSLFATGTQLYLEVELPTPATATCASNGCATWTEGAMTPRQPLASSPYAFNSDTLDGLDSSAFGQLSASNAFTGANTFSPGSGVGITVQAAAATHSLDVKDSSGSVQAYFDANGNLNLSRTLQATASNSIDLGASGATFRTGYFGTSVVTPALNAPSSGGTLATNAGTLQRTASGTFTIDLNDGAGTTLAVTNSGAGAANLTVDGGVTVGAFATATSVPVCSNSGQLASCNSNPSGVNLQQAYAAGNAISTTGSDVAFTLNSSQNFTVATAAGATGSSTFSLADGSNATPPGQLVLIRNNDTDQPLAAGLKVTTAGGGITTALDASGSGITNALSVGANTILGTTGAINYTNYDLSSMGDQTAAFTQLNGSTTTSSNQNNTSTSMSVTSSTNFDIGNYLQLSSTDCNGSGSGINVCYAKITNIVSNTLTISPALRWASGSAVVEYHIPEIGGTDLAQSLANRYGRGYFIAGVATGNGTTYYNQDSISTSLTTFDLLTTASTINLGGATTSVTLAGNLATTGTGTITSAGAVTGTQINGTTGIYTGTSSGTERIDSSGNLLNIGDITASAALTLAATGSGNSLTLDTGGGAGGTAVILGPNATTIQKAASSLTLDVTNAGASTLFVTNSNGSNVANLDVSGNLNIGAGKVFSVNGTGGRALTCSSGQVIDGIAVTGGIITGGACTDLSGDKLVGVWTSQQGTTDTNTQFTVNFTGAVGSSPNFSNATHTLQLPSNASKLVMQMKAGGGGGGTPGTAATNKLTGGGGEGGYTEKTILGSLASNYYFKVGGGGAGGASGSNGNTGGSSCFGTNSGDACTSPLDSATGGSGGATANSLVGVAGGNGGTGSSGDVNINGAPGTASGVSTGQRTAGIYSGTGGGASGGQPALTATCTTGSAGSSGGGGGGVWCSTASTATGGAGGDGYLKLMVYIPAGGGGGGGSGSETLQDAYNLASTPELVLNSSNGGLTVRDSSGGIGSNLLEVQDNSGSTNYLAVNTTGTTLNGTLTVGTAIAGAGALTVSSGGATTLGIDTGGAAALTLGGTNANVINIANQSINGADINIGNNNTSHNVNIANGSASNTVTIGSTTGGSTTLQAGNSSLGVATGGVTVKTATNSATAFQVQNSVGAPVLMADTTSTQSDGTTPLNYLSYSGFENGTVGSTPTGWTDQSPGVTHLNANKKFTYNGLYSVQMVSGGAGGGMSTNQFTATPPADTYLVSFFVRLTAGTNMTADKFVVTATDGATNPTCSPSASTTLSTSVAGFQRVYCQLQTTANMTNLKIAINSTGRTVYIDAAQLQSTNFNGSTLTAPTPYTLGSVQIRGVVTNALALVNNGDSTAAFQIQNAAGTSNLLVADTLNSRIGIGTAAPTQALDVSGNINATAYYAGGSAGQDLSACGAGTALSGAVFTKGILTTAGSCISVGGASGASTDLSNLTATAINQTLQPASGSSNSLDLGAASTNLWRSGYFGTSVQSPSYTGSGAVSVSSGGTSNLTLDSLSGNLILGSNTTTVQKAASALAIDLTNAGTSTLTVENSNGSNVANLSVTGGLTIGAGQAITVGSTAGATKTCIAGQVLDGITTVGGVVTGGSCTTPVGGGGASVTLNNLGATAVNTAISPDATANNRDLGDSTHLWHTLYVGTSIQASSSSALTLDVNNGNSDSTLNVSNTGGTGNITLALDSGGTFAVGANTGQAQSVSCGAGQAVTSGTFTGGILTATLGCSAIAAGSGATTALDNLTTTAINATLQPAVASSNSLDLGGTSNLWRSGYFGTSVITPALNASTAGGTITTTAGTLQSADSLTLDLNKAATTTLTVTNSDATHVANVSVEGGLTIGSGQAITVGSSAGQTQTVSCSSGQTITSGAFSGGVLTTSLGCSAITGFATTSLNNVSSTSIGADLVASTNNTYSLGSAATVWQNVYAANLDAGTTTTGLTIGTASTTTAVTIGRAGGFAVGLPGGLTTSGGNVATAGGNITTVNGTINTGSGNITTTGTLTAGTVTGNALSFQPTTDIRAGLIKQSSAASPTQDIFDVQTAGGANLLQTTSTGALTLNSPTSLTVTAGAGSTWSTTAGDLNITAGGNLNLGAGGSSTIRIGGATNNMTFASTGEPTLNGTAQHTRVVTLAPEYAGATLAASGTNNSGNMTASFCSTIRHINDSTNGTNVCTTAGDEHNYYQWNPTVASPAQTYDVYLRYQLPSDFSSASSLSMYGWRTGSSDSVTLSLYDGTSSHTLCGSSTNVATTNTTWTSNTYTINTCTLNAGDTVLFKVDLSATSTSDFARAGEIKFTYSSKW